MTGARSKALGAPRRGVGPPKGDGLRLGGWGQEWWQTPATASTAYDKLQLTYFKETREKAFQQVTACTLPPQNAVYVCAACIPEGREKEMRIQIPEGIRKKERNEPRISGLKRAFLLSSPTKKSFLAPFPLRNVSLWIIRLTK